MTRNKEKIKEYNEKRRTKNPIKFRALILIASYKRDDLKSGRGSGDLGTDFMMELMNKPCAHCGKTGWDVIGCNRLDNSKPHTMDNVEPCCWECNNQLHHKELSKQVYQYTLEGELVKIWPSTKECGRNGYITTSVRNCCNGGRWYSRNGVKKWTKSNIHKGFRWSYEPL